MGLERAVWVDLKQLYRRGAPEEAAGLHPRLRDDLDLDIEVLGILHEWTRSGRGLWLGVVSFEVPYREGEGNRHRAVRQLVPAYAMRPQNRPPSPLTGPAPG